MTPFERSRSDTNEVKALPKYYIYFERHTERESDRYIGCIEPPPLISLKKKKRRASPLPISYETRGASANKLPL